MTNEEAIKMIKAKKKCLENESSGQYGLCGSRDCDDCDINYIQGNLGEQIEWLGLAIKALEEQDKHRWIPVSERLPMNDEYDLYDMNLVTLDNGDVCLGVYRLDDKVWYTRMQEGEDKYSTNHTVTAWMPLPEGYKQVE